MKNAGDGNATKEFTAGDTAATYTSKRYVYSRSSSYCQ